MLYPNSLFFISEKKDVSVSLQTLNIFENLLSFKNACLQKESDERLHPSFPSFARRPQATLV